MFKIINQKQNEIRYNVLVGSMCYTMMASSDRSDMRSHIDRGELDTRVEVNKLTPSREATVA